MFKNNRNLLIIALIALVNALGYGIIIPVLYSYSHRFGLSDFQNGLLFASFSIAQFIATPIIGRMSDKYGRRPLLIISLAGTALSFFMMAWAPTALFLFAARILDGFTAGNIPVASAVISDTTREEDRAKGFGLIGASFGFGLIFGPAISALTVGLSPAFPFYFAGAVSGIAVLITLLFLPETNKHIGDVKKGKLFDFTHLFHALFHPNLGFTFLITLFYSFMFSAFIYGFQVYTVKTLLLSPSQVSLVYMLFGMVGVITQVVLVPLITKRLGLKRSFIVSISVTTFALFCMFLFQSLMPFIAIAILFGLFNGIAQPLTNAIISKETDAKSQGSMMGLNASYMSIGQIIGPVAAGAIAVYSPAHPFLLGGVAAGICIFFATRVLQPKAPVETAF